MGPLNSIFGQNPEKIVISTPNVTHLDQCKDVGVMVMQLMYSIIYNNVDFGYPVNSTVTGVTFQELSSNQPIF